MIIRTEDARVFKDWSNCEIKDTNGKLLKTVGSREEANEFLKKHFHGDNLFPCDIRVEFNGCVGYRFEVKSEK